MYYNENIRPYLIINGKSSRTVNGLLISSLAPITKPPIRTKIETIDGRDGDIVTTLGYGAYDKAVEIGLAGDYDVDDVIDFFNSSGRVVFSNEPDKYYKFSIYKQIDLERLIRFKKAKVIFHTQPFKFSESETPKHFSNIQGVITVRNNGNIKSRPTITLNGIGQSKFYLNGVQLLTIDFGYIAKTIIIDTEAMNAYAEDGQLLNRSIAGDYDKISLITGSNTIRFDGGVINSLEIANYSRWI